MMTSVINWSWRAGCIMVFYTLFDEEAPFYKQFGRGGTILLGKFGRRSVEFFYLCPKLCWRLAGVSFYGLYFSWRAGHLDQVILLVWPNVKTLSFTLGINIKSGFAAFMNNFGQNLCFVSLSSSATPCRLQQRALAPVTVVWMMNV